MEQLCGDAFVWIYDRSKKNLVTEDLLESMRSAKNYLYLTLKSKYASWCRLLIAYYGLEGLNFNSLDPDTAMVDARRIAEELRMTEKDFYSLAGDLDLPLIGRETRTYKLMHQEHAALILGRARDRFSYYDRLKRKVA